MSPPSTGQASRRHGAGLSSPGTARRGAVPVDMATVRHRSPSWRSSDSAQAAVDVASATSRVSRPGRFKASTCTPPPDRVVAVSGAGAVGSTVGRSSCTIVPMSPGVSPGVSVRAGVDASEASGVVAGVGASPFDAVSSSSAGVVAEPSEWASLEPASLPGSVPESLLVSAVPASGVASVGSSEAVSSVGGVGRRPGSCGTSAASGGSAADRSSR